MEMNIFTSYHHKAEKLIEMGLTPISISAQFPPYSKIKYHQYKVVAPRYEMLQMSLDDYDIEFQKILGGLNTVHVHSDLVKLSGGKDIVLLCFEKDPENCHRQKVAKWLEKKLQIKVKEITFITPKKETKKDSNDERQLKIF